MSRDYVPAAGFKALTGLYDPIMALTMRENLWRPMVAKRLAETLDQGSSIVEVGTGTGTLAMQIAAQIPGVDLVAVDGDPDALEIARGKDPEASVRWIEGRAERLPIGDDSAGGCVISLVLHHLGPDEKRQALVEARRVLVPGGRLVVVDFGRPRLPAAPGFLALRFIDGFPNTAEHARGRIPTLIEGAGFSYLELLGRFNTAWGTVELIEAVA